MVRIHVRRIARSTLPSNIREKGKKAEDTLVLSINEGGGRGGARYDCKLSFERFYLP